MNTTDFSIKVLGKTMPLTVLEALGLLEAGIKTGTAMAAVPAEKKEKLYGLIQAMPAKMTGYMDFSHAQVCSGGVSTEEIDRETMESRLNLKMIGRMENR